MYAKNLTKNKTQPENAFSKAEQLLHNRQYHPSETLLALSTPDKG